MILKLGVEHYVLKLYKVCINDDPEFTLITTRSNLAKLVFVLGPGIRILGGRLETCFCTRPRYQNSGRQTGNLLLY